MHPFLQLNAMLRDQQPALMLYLLGLGSLIRGLTLDQLTSAGGTWSWKYIETLSFVLGDTRPARWGLFGGGCLLSAMLGILVTRGTRMARPFATLLLVGDLMLCAQLGDGVNTSLHGLGILTLWFSRPVPRPTLSEPSDTSASTPSAPSA
jgi:hypothetical protein